MKVIDNSNKNVTYISQIKDGTVFKFLDKKIPGTFLKSHIDCTKDNVIYATDLMSGTILKVSPENAIKVAVGVKLIINEWED